MPPYSIRFERSLPETILYTSVEHGLKKFLESVYLLRPEVISPEYAFDLHLREKSKIMIYHGGTCLLDIDLSRMESTGKMIFRSKSYGKKEPSVTSFDRLKMEKNLSDIKTVTQKTADFLKLAARGVHPKFYNNKKEGYWSSRLSIDFGRNWTPDKKWLVFDREAVLGFENKKEKAVYYTEMKQQADQTLSDLRCEDPNKWGLSTKSFGDELDHLAIGPDGQLVCIELKHGSFTTGISLSPVQASTYRQAFRGALDRISDELISLVQQKVTLGLLPQSALGRIPKKFEKVEGVVLVAEPNLRSNCFSKALEVNGKLNEHVDIYTIDTFNNLKCFS